MAEQKLANPAVVGLSAFGLTTLVLQFHNLGWCGVGPVLACALIFGGLAQFIAGLQEMKTGNSFGYLAFTGYGSFWISLGVIFLLNHFGIYKSSATDTGWFLVAWTLFTVILWIGSMRVNTTLAITFTLLLIGFILLDLAHFGSPALTKIAAWDLIACALFAWYTMAHALYIEVFGRDVLPAGKPWIKDKS